MAPRTSIVTVTDAEEIRSRQYPELWIHKPRTSERNDVGSPYFCWVTVVSELVTSIRFSDNYSVKERQYSPDFVQNSPTMTQRYVGTFKTICEFVAFNLHFEGSKKRKVT